MFPFQHSCGDTLSVTVGTHPLWDLSSTAITARRVIASVKLMYAETIATVVGCPTILLVALCQPWLLTQPIYRIRLLMEQDIHRPQPRFSKLWHGTVFATILAFRTLFRCMRRGWWQFHGGEWRHSSRRYC
jgi:hypothetical protein